MVASIGWSGDEALIGMDEIQWRMPTEGCLLWSDNMVIPGRRRPTRRRRLAWMDFVYQSPRSRLTSPPTRESSVRWRASRRSIRAWPATSSVNPPEEFTADCSFLPDPPGSEEDVAEANEAFQEVITQ